jgi:imidazolonepropionase-like amidohydrolase
MPISRSSTAFVWLLAASSCAAQEPGKADDFIRIRASQVALEHVEIIDGTGGESRRDQVILISDGKIAAIGNAGSVAIPQEASRIELTGYSAIPGLVGMHDHLFYVTSSVNDNYLVHDMPLSFPRLFLANGVTTIRTTGSYEPFTDLEIKRAVDQGKMIGPKIHVTGPYLVDQELGQIQIHALAGPEDARRTVNYWAAEGATSFKAYEYITRAELKAAIEEAHRHGLTVAGHLCSIGFTEAATLGIDSLEHGLMVDTEFVPGKKPDVCPESNWPGTLELDVNGKEIQATIDTLVKHRVAITSTLAIYESFLVSWPGAPQPALDSLNEDSLKGYEAYRSRQAEVASDASKRDVNQQRSAMFRKEMEFEKAFARGGGLLLAGSDAVLNGVIAGFADLREIELLVEAGFTPVEAIKIATLNGAQFLKESVHIGSLEPGKQADIVIVKGSPSTNIHDIENVELVFKDGIGYDSKKLIASVKGQVGIR